VETLPHDLENEKRIIALCHGEQKLIDHLDPKYFYNTDMKNLYDVFKNKTLEIFSPEDAEKHVVDWNLLMECSMVDPVPYFGESEGMLQKIKSYYKRREDIKSKQRDIESLYDLKTEIDLSEGEKDGYEGYMEDIESIGNGDFAIMHTPWPRLDEDTRFTEGKSICLIVGEPGCSKSFFMCQLFLLWIVSGLKVILWGAENNPRFHARRAIAQYIGDSNLCDYEYLRTHKNKVKEIFKNNRKVIEDVMETLYTSEDMSKDNLIKWCWARAREGYKAIGIDPLTFFSSGDNIAESDLQIMKALNDIIKIYKVRFIIVTHPRTSDGGDISMDNIAGSRNLSRFAQNIIWISRRDDAEHDNRVFYNLKTRNGTRKYGGKIPMNFNGDTVCFNEV